MKILLTGSNGLLGQKLVHKLASRPDIDLVATSRGANRLLQQKGYAYSAMDIADAAEVQKVIEMHKPDSVIHTAAMTHVDVCHKEPENCRKMNVEATENIVKACKHVGSHLVHLSTDFIFDGEDGPYSENDEPSPLSVYGESKLASEKVVQQSGLPAAILRTILLYGVAENMSRSNIVLWAKEALSEPKNINVVDDQFRSPTLAEDLADACILAAEKRAEGIFHISGPETMSVLDLVYKVAHFWKLDKELISRVSSSTLSQPAKRPPRTGFDISKARRELGFEPHTFEEGLALVDKQLHSR